METERNYAGEFLISEAPGTRSREQVTVALSQTLKAGSVIAKAALGNATVAAPVALGTNTGNGTWGTVTADAGAPAGDYTVEIIEPGTNAGTFIVRKPDGTEDGHGVVGSAYNGTINGTLSDGATDFVAGDSWKVNVSYAAGAGTVGAVDPTATNGMQTAIGVLWDQAITDDSSTVEAAAIVRDAEVAGDMLDFGALNTGQVTQAKADLAAAGIVIR